MNAKGTSWLGPGLAAALLVAITVLHTVERSTEGNVDLYMARVAEEIDQIPASFGAFVGRDSEVAPGAIQLLKPNRLVQRRYTDVVSGQGEQFSLLLVHSKVAKDMNGHFPPVCYPNSGWKMVAEPEDLVIDVGELKIPAKRYRFGKPDQLLAEPMDILSFFILPTGQIRFGGDMSLVDRSSRLPWTDKLGAAQIQILTPASMTEHGRREIWDQVLGAVAPTLHAIAEGPA